MAVRNVKLALMVERLTYPKPGIFPKNRQRELVERADAFSLRHPPYLRALLDGSERELIQEMANSGKEIFYHGGCGIVGDHVLHVPSKERKSEIIKDEGFPRFVADGYFKVINELGIDFVSFHLGLGNKVVYVDTEKKVEKGKYYRKWWAEGKIKHRQWLGLFQERLETIRGIYQGRLAFENIPLNPGIENRGWRTYVCHHSFISEVFHEVKGIHFLLDLGHAQVTAARLGMGVEHYLKALPLTRVIEIHICAAGRDGETVFDAHGMPKESDLTLLKWLIKERGVNPEYITIEHYNEDNLVRSFDEVGDLLAGL